MPAGLQKQKALYYAVANGKVVSENSEKIPIQGVAISMFDDTGAELIPINGNQTTTHDGNFTIWFRHAIDLSVTSKISLASSYDAKLTVVLSKPGYIRQNKSITVNFHLVIPEQGIKSFDNWERKNVFSKRKFISYPQYYILQRQ